MSTNESYILLFYFRRWLWPRRRYLGQEGSGKSKTILIPNKAVPWLKFIFLEVDPITITDIIRLNAHVDGFGVAPEVSNPLTGPTDNWRPTALNNQ